MIHRSLLLSSLLLVAIVAAGCKEDTNAPVNSPAGVYKSAPVTLGDGTAYGWEQLDDAGNPVAIGVNFTESALSGLPTTATMINIALPMKSSKSPFDHISLDWNPQGHEPPGVYDVPHFDVHFYMIPESQQAGILGGPDTIPVMPAYMPAGYFSTGQSVPNMGTHWLDATAPELNGQLFTRTFIYGFSKGDLIFLEPMITKAYFEKKLDETKDISQPQAFARSGMYYPISYRVKFDAAQAEYSVVLEGLRMK